MTFSSTSRIFVAGHRGMVGAAVVRRLQQRGFNNLLLASRSELDLTCQASVHQWFSANRPDVVVFAAAKVGGIHANNSYPAEFIRTNLQIETNVIHHAWRYRVKRLLFLGSSCIYPRSAPQPMREEYLLSGALEPTNEPYAVAKIAGYTLCEALKVQHSFNYVALMPTNLYGPNDNYSPLASHVIPGLIAKLHAAKIKGEPTYSCWGTGSALREFLYSDDLADAAMCLAEMSEVSGLVNVGYGSDVSIRDLVYKVAKVVGYRGDIVWDASKPDGTPRKILDSSRLRNIVPWTPKVSLDIGLPLAYQDFLSKSLRT
jgi:GDP-L-fucose synthase